MPLHIDNWIIKADQDFYIMFIKAWIPFNAWYFAEYNTTNDSDGLKHVKTTNNKVRNRIIALLSNNDSASLKFRSDVALLHHQLVQRTILNRRRQVSFRSIKLDEYFPELITHHDDGVVYKVIPHQVNGFRIVVVNGDGTKTHMDKTLNPYGLQTLLLENQFIALPNESMKMIVRRLFEEVDPDKPFDLVSNAGTGIMMSSEINLWFKNEMELIAKALIQILYELRCLLFHGILDPSPVNQPIYEHAYNILNILIKELKQQQ